jgi:hypothetical protein
MRQPITARLSKYRHICVTCSKTYIDFIGHAETIMAQPHQSLRGDALTSWNAPRVAAFEAINNQVWGGQYPGGQAAALKHPTKFIQASYHAQTFALGAAGNYLGIAKERVGAANTNENATQEVKKASLNLMKTADTAYERVHKLVKDIYLPMTPSSLLKHGPIVNSARVNIFSLSGKIEFKAGFTYNPLSHEAPGDQKDPPKGAPPAPVSRGGNNPIVVTNNLGELGGSFEVKPSLVEAHPEPDRGDVEFLDITLQYDGGSITGPLINKIILTALQKIYPDYSIEQRKTQAQDIDAALLGSMFDTAAGAKLNIRLIKPIYSDNYALEAMTGFISTKDGFSIGIPIPNPGGVTTIGLKTGSKIDNPQVVILGTSLSMQRMQLDKFLEMMGLEGKGDASTLPELFAKHPQVANAFLGLKSLIPGVIDKSLEFSAELQNAADTNRQVVDKSATNEFFKLLKPPYDGINRTLDKRQQNAPGSTVKETERGTEAYNPTAQATVKETWPSHLALTKQQWDEAKTTINSLSGPQALAKYYATENGRKVLDAYLKIMTRYEDIHGAAMMRGDGNTSLKPNQGFFPTLQFPHPVGTTGTPQFGNIQASPSPTILQRYSFPNQEIPDLVVNPIRTTPIDLSNQPLKTIKENTANTDNSMEIQTLVPSSEHFNTKLLEGRTETERMSSLSVLGRQALIEEGYQVVPNDGKGNNCFLLALLQGASRDNIQPKESLERQANAIRQVLRKEFPEQVSASNMLTLSEGLMKRTIALVDAQYPGGLRVKVYQPGENGSVVLNDSHDQPSRFGRIAKDINIYYSNNHFEWFHKIPPDTDSP